MVLVVRHGFFCVENCVESGKKGKDSLVFCQNCQFCGFFPYENARYGPHLVSKKKKKEQLCGLLC